MQAENDTKDLKNLVRILCRPKTQISIELTAENFKNHQRTDKKGHLRKNIHLVKQSL